jgi:AhpD family alkylhydroperoxidase
MEPRFNLFETEFGAKFAKRFANLGMALQQSQLPRNLGELIALRASQINGCGWCADMHTKELAAAGESAVRINLVATWRESTVFTEAERAALALTEEGTRIADASPGVSDETWAAARKHFDDEQLAAVISGIALINAANRLSVIVRQRGGSYEPGMFDRMFES